MPLARLAGCLLPILLQSSCASKKALLNLNGSLNVFLAVCGLLLFTGCATDIGKKARTAGVNSVRMEPRIDTDEPMRVGFRENSGNLSVILANVIVNETSQKKLSLISSNMQHNGIDVHEMVRRQSAMMLVAQKGLSVVTNGGDSVLVVAIQQYGIAGGFGYYVPFIALRGELTRNGERIWRGEGQAHPNRSGKVAKLEEFHANPEVLRERWEAQVDFALRDLFQVPDPSGPPRAATVSGNRKGGF